MNFWKKLNIILTVQMDRYSPFVDRLIRTVIEEGEILNRDKHTVTVRFRGKNYHVWLANTYYADLSCMRDIATDQFVYNNKRPSRATKIAFWEWLERNGVVTEKVDSDTERIKQILEESNG